MTAYAVAMAGAVELPILGADCSSCVGLCCVALSLTTSADFAVDKPAYRPCANLRDDFQCAVHTTLRSVGFAGCTAYDCFGAGQRVTSAFRGDSWRDRPSMLDVFPLMVELHHLIWLMREAAELLPTDETRGLLGALVALSGGEEADLAGIDPFPLRDLVGDLLLRVSAEVRARYHRQCPDLRKARLPGADLRGQDLTAADLRGADLLSADLRHADLTGADLFTADLRGAQLAGASLAGALFMTQMQLNTANGDATTTLPPRLSPPGHWTA